MSIEEEKQLETENKNQSTSRQKNAPQAMPATTVNTAERKPWMDWAKEIGTAASVARGACVMAKCDPDCPVSRELFEKAVLDFAGQKIGGRK